MIPVAIIHFRRLVALALLALFFPNAQGATLHFYSQTADFKWSTVANWFQGAPPVGGQQRLPAGRLPNADDDVILTANLDATGETISIAAITARGAVIGGIFTVHTLLLTPQSRFNSSTLNITSSFKTQGSVSMADITLNILPGATASIETTSASPNGALSVSGASLIENHGRFFIRAGGLLTFTGASKFANYPNAELRGIGQSRISGSSVLDNNGVIRAEFGLLTLQGLEIISSLGAPTFYAGPEGAIDYNTYFITIAEGSTGAFTGPGKHKFTRDLRVDGSMQIGSPTEPTQCEMRFENNGPKTVKGQIHLRGRLTLLSGHLDFQELLIYPGSELDFSYVNTHVITLNSGTIQNRGLVKFINGARVYFGTQAVLHNHADGRVEMEKGGLQPSQNSPGRILNYGAFINTAETNLVRANFFNYGLVEATAGDFGFGQFTQHAGELKIRGDQRLDSVASVVIESGKLTARGNSEGVFTTDGDWSFGPWPGTFKANSLVLKPSSKIEIKLGGPDPSEYDHIVASDSDLDGEINIKLINGYRPAPGDRFLIFSGSLSGAITVNGADLGEGLFLFEERNQQGLSLVAATAAFTQPRMEFTHSASGPRITFPSLPTRTYNLEYSTDLKQWTTLRRLTAQGTTTSVEGLVSSANPKRFYRLR